jgi:hypothetical protein
LLEVDPLSKKSRTLAHSFGSVRRLRRVGHDGDLVVIALRNSELSPNFGDGLSRSGGGGYGLTVSRFSDDLDPVVECHTKNEFWQLVVAIETTPAFVRGLKQFEDHRERRPVGQATLRSDGAVAHGGEGAFNGIGRPQVFPVLGGEVVERQ